MISNRASTKVMAIVISFVILLLQTPITAAADGGSSYGGNDISNIGEITTFIPLEKSPDVVRTYEELATAIESADSGDTIWIANDIDIPQTIDIRDKSLRLQATHDDEEIILTTSSGYRHFLISGREVYFTTKGIVLDGEENGGGVRSNADHLILDAVIQNCLATDIADDPYNVKHSYGGGVYTTNRLTLVGGRISGNKADHGGGIYGFYNSTIIIANGEISYNLANLIGGGVYADINSDITITGGKISRNTAIHEGGGVAGSGGWVDATFTTLTLLGGKISENTAGFSAGGIRVDGRMIFVMEGGEISGNSAAYYGGGVYGYPENVFITSGRITGNSAEYMGGGISIHSASNIIMEGGEISGNSAKMVGGGLHVFSPSTITITGGNISSNIAYEGGGGVWIGEYDFTNYIAYPDPSQLEIRNNTVVENNLSHQAYQMTNPADIALHNRQIDPTVTWTSDFEYIYNNHDVGYNRGVAILNPTYIVTLTQHWTDDAHSDIVTLYEVDEGKSFHTTFTVPDGYEVLVDFHSDEVDVDLETGLVSISSITSDVEITIIYMPVIAKHTITVIYQYRNNEYPEQRELYEVSDGGAFNGLIILPIGYEVDTSSVPSGVVVDLKARTFHIADVTRDVIVIFEVYSPDESILVESIDLNVGSLNMLRIGGTLHLDPIILPQNATDKSVTYVSNNPAVASVDGNGLITANKTGTALITGTTSNGKVSKTTVRVSY